MLNENLLKHLNRPKINLSPKYSPESSLYRGIAEPIGIVEKVDGDICTVRLGGAVCKYTPIRVDHKCDPSGRYVTIEGRINSIS